VAIDKSQEKVIYAPINQSFFITAPPGYGKTHVITERVKHIIESGNIMPPFKILALTFSNSAANEMKIRIKKEIPKADDYVDIMNFHTFAYYVLKMYGNNIGIDRDFTIITEEEEYQFKKKFFNDLGWLKKDFDDVKYINQGYDSWYSQNFLGNNNFDPEYLEYNELRLKIENELITKDHLNFNYILFRSLELFDTYPTLKDVFFNKYHIILADEFQDTNSPQYLLFKEIATNSDGNKRPVFVVGDKKQAIMGFQGASIENITKLIEDFDCNEHELTQNHRAASDKIKGLTDCLRNSTNVNIDPVVMYSAIKSNSTKINAVEKINREIVENILKMKDSGIKLEDICVLFPQEKSSIPLKKELNQQKIDFVLITDFNFKSINRNYSELFKEVLILIENHHDKNNVGTIVKQIIDKYYPDSDEDLVLKTIKNFSKKYCKINYPHSEVWEILQEFYNHLQMDIDWTNLLRSKTKGKLFLSTIHSVKGLEFDYILMVGIVNYQLPHSSICNICKPYNNFLPKLEVPESKNQFYVGVSRAITDILFFFGNQELNSNGVLKERKISCVFEDMKDLIRYINVYNDIEYDCNDARIKRFLCKH
jgi:DNA helicase-2/ATP-dependent DNA helicase PcrA